RVGLDAPRHLRRLFQKLRLRALGVGAERLADPAQLVAQAREATAEIRQQRLGAALRLVGFVDRGGDRRASILEVIARHRNNEFVDEKEKQEEIDRGENQLGRRGGVVLLGLRSERGRRQEERQERYEEPPHPTFLPRTFSAIWRAMSSASLSACARP